MRKLKKKTFKHLETIWSVNILKLDTGRSETIKRAFIRYKKRQLISIGVNAKGIRTADED